MLVSEGMLNVAEGIELIECNKIVDSDHFGYLTDLNLETYFEEEFNKEREIEYRSLNPKKRTHRKKFAEMCKELLNVIPIEHELEHIERHKDRAKMEQLDKDITFVLQKARSKAEGERKGMQGCKEKMKKRAAV